MSATSVDFDEEPWDVFGLLNRLKAHWRTILLSAIVVGALAGAVAFLSTPTYRAEVVVVPSNEQRAGGSALAGLADQVGAFLPVSLPLGRNGPVEPVALLRSRLLAGEFIRRNDLLPQLFPERWDAARKQWIIDGGKRPPTLRSGVTVFLERVLNVDDETTFGLVKVRIEGPNRTTVAEWGNGIISLANEMTRKRAIESAKRRLEFLQAELDSTESLEVRQAIYRVIEAEVKSKMLASVQRDSAFRVVDPAAVPDEFEYIKPRRALMIGVGVWLGTCMGIVLAFLQVALTERRRKASLRALQR